MRYRSEKRSRRPTEAEKPAEHSLHPAAFRCETASRADCTISLLAAPYLEAARYRACASRRACIRAAHVFRASIMTVAPRPTADSSSAMGYAQMTKNKYIACLVHASGVDS